MPESWLVKDTDDSKRVTAFIYSLCGIPASLEIGITKLANGRIAFDGKAEYLDINPPGLGNLVDIVVETTKRMIGDPAKRVLVADKTIDVLMYTLRLMVMPLSEGGSISHVDMESYAMHDKQYVKRVVEALVDILSKLFLSLRRILERTMLQK